MTTVAIPKQQRSADHSDEPDILTDPFVCAVVRKAQRIEKHRMEAAKEQVPAYRILSCEGPAGHLGRVSIDRPREEHSSPVVVDTLWDCCTCQEHGIGGVVTRARRDLVAIGFTIPDLIVRGAWPHCRHQLIVTLKEMDSPEEFDQANPFWEDAA